MHKYEICVEVTGYVTVQVNAETLDEAEFAAMDQVNEMDFGPLGNVDYQINECGNMDLGPAYNG